MSSWRLFVCIACLLAWTLGSECFAQGSKSSSYPFPFPVGDQPGGVSSWTDYRGQEFEGYASIGGTGSIKFWERRLRSHRDICLNSDSYKDLNHLWRIMFKWSNATKDASSKDPDSKPVEFSNIEELLREGSTEQKSILYPRAQELADAYADFRLASQKSPQERTTDYFDACRLRLVAMVGEGAVRDLEESWSAHSKLPNNTQKRQVGK